MRSVTIAKLSVAILATTSIFLNINYDFNYGRNPASILDSEKINLLLFNDYFSYDDSNPYLTYETDLNFRTNVDAKYVEDQGRHVFNKALGMTLEKVTGGDLKEQAEEDSKKQSITSLFSTNLKAQIIENFVKTLNVLKIINGAFQIDINFVPKIHKKISYRPELTNNQLIQLDDTRKLFSKLTHDEASLATRVFINNSKPSSDIYQYRGGQITLFIKLLDLHFNLEDPIPKTKKKAVKGFIRYRRYFNGNNLDRIIPKVSTKDLKISEMQVDAKNKNFFVTVDSYESFTLAELAPKFDRMEITFGKILPDNFSNKSFFKKMVSSSPAAIETGSLKISGKVYNKEEWSNFTTELEKVVIKFEDSQPILSGDFQTSIEEGNYLSKIAVADKVQQILKGKYSKKLMRLLHVPRLSKKIGGEL